VAGTGITVSNSTGAVTFGVAAATTSSLGAVQPDGTTITVSGGVISAATQPASGFTFSTTTQSSTLTLNFDGSTVVFWQPGTAGNRTITLGNFVANKKIQLWITPKAAPNTFTFTGVTGSQCSNGSNVYVLGGGGSGQTSMLIDIYSTTTSVGGVWIFAHGGV
jgi:hypothetical protein